MTMERATVSGVGERKSFGRALGFAAGFYFVLCWMLYNLASLHLAEPVAFLVAAIVAIVAAVALSRPAPRLAGRAARAAGLLLRIPASTFYLGSLAVGIALRLAWVLAVPTPFRSDMVVYHALAVRLANGEPYQSASTYAYWPPGLPAAYSVLIRFFGDAPATYISFNIFLLLVIGAVLLLGVGRLYGSLARRIAALLLLLWPTDILLTGILSKELLLTTLFVLAIAAWQESATARLIPRSSIWAGAGGVLFAGAAMTQPSVMLFPGVLAIIELLGSTAFTSVLRRLMIFGICALIAIAPWTIRNYLVLGTLVPGTTSAGFNFLASNNPTAPDGYGEAETLLPRFGELEGGRMGFALGRQWIGEHPRDAAWLAFEKHVRFLGDDSYGAFESLKRGHDENTPLYVAAKALSDLWWLGLILLVIATARLSLTERVSQIAALGLVYFVVVHTAFESNGRHHIALTPLLIMMAAIGISRWVEASGRTAQPDGIAHL